MTGTLTTDTARSVLSDLTQYDDATIRAAARQLMQSGDPSDIQTARRYLNFGLRNTGNAK